MNAVAYIYLPTPQPDQVLAMLESALDGFAVSHFGTRDPPKRQRGAPSDIEQALMAQPELNKHVYLRDEAQHIDMTVDLYFDSRWTHSQISFDGPSDNSVETIARRIASRLAAFLCIKGTMSLGKDQPWQVLHLREDCPASIRAVVEA